MDKADSDRSPLPCFCPHWDRSRVSVCRRYIASGFICREFEKAIASAGQSLQNPPIAPTADRADKPSNQARRIITHNRRARKRQINSRQFCKSVLPRRF